MNFINNFLGMHNQSGGGGSHCSICGSIGVRKSTCPLNPKAQNPNPSKHPLAKKKNRRIKRKSKQKKTSPTKRKTSKSSSMSPTTKRQRELRMGDQITRHIYHGQRELLEKLFTKHPAIRPVINKKLDTLNMNIENMPPLIVQTRRRTRRGKTNFEATDILLDPIAANAVNQVILAAHATPGFVKQAETVHRDTINRWIRDNSGNYDIIP